MKSARRRDLLKILYQGHASTQQEFVDALREAGHDVTQATVSRDLQELGAVKVRVGDQVAYRFPDELVRAAPLNGGAERGLMRELADFAIDIRVAGTLVVVITLPGHAAAIARAIDLAAIDGATGTIAGDDTVFVATPDPDTARRISEQWLHPQGTDEKGVS
ncbi:MAG TPA: arginine repressor [Actinomycetota bacterium]|nr:arginine repressor [Actinomycetota bacterium]